MSTRSTLNTATLAFITLAAVALGGLIGMAIIGERTPHDYASHDHKTAQPDGADALPGERRLDFRLYDGRTAPALPGDGDDVVAGAVGQNVVRAGQRYQTSTIELEIPGDGAIEYKAVMRSGAPLVYSWRANGPLYFDFHGHDDRNESGYFSRYADGESIADAGGIVAAYDGQHGWYWQNTGTEAVQVTLNVAGFYDELLKLEF